MGTTAPTLPAERVAELREKHYNATITHYAKANDRLVRLRVKLDADASDKPFHYEPGQYTTLGLGYWEERTPLAQQESLDVRSLERVVKRAYSISCRLLDDGGQIVPAGDEEDIEFYVALVTEAEKPPSFTPRLFLLKEGDRLQMGAKPKGHFTLGDPDDGGVGPDDDVLFCSTGTGEAPHNTMASKLLADGHRGRIANVCCVRYRSDLAYTLEHGRLMERYANYRYVPLTTREPENRDESAPGYVGLRYIQDLLLSDSVADEIGFALDPQRVKVFLCGNPIMIGVPRKDGHPDGRYPGPRGVVEVLEGLGFRANEPKKPGNVFFEKYW